MRGPWLVCAGVVSQKIFLVIKSRNGKVELALEGWISSEVYKWIEKRVSMMIVMVLATLLLITAIALLGGTILVYLKAAVSEPSRVEQIRHLRQEGLAVSQEGEE